MADEVKCAEYMDEVLHGRGVLYKWALDGPVEGSCRGCSRWAHIWVFFGR